MKLNKEQDEPLKKHNQTEEDKLDRQREHFNGIAQKYFEARSGEKQIVLHDLIYRDLFRDLFKTDKKISVLEAMCGYGEGKRILEQYIPSEMMEYEGFDYSQEIVKCAKELDETINIYVQDVTKFKTNKKYDVILIIGGLHHVPDYAGDVVDNLSNCLKEGGYFINIEPTYNNVISAFICKTIYKRNALFDEQTERRFSLKELNQYYYDHGLKIKKQMHAGLLAYTLWYNPDAFPLLNFGASSWVRKVYNFDKKFFYNFIGRKLSFATFSVLEKV